MKNRTETSAAISVPNYPKELYDAAAIENEHRDFNARLAEVRSPTKVEYIPPPVPDAVSKQTRLEMETGSKRVKQFEVQRAEQQAIAARVPEPWEGKTVPIFRPGDAREYKDVKGTNVSKDAVAQPTPRA